jgi:hypothetical protein
MKTMHLWCLKEKNLEKTEDKLVTTQFHSNIENIPWNSQCDNTLKKS